MRDENELPDNDSTGRIAALEQQIAAIRKEELRKRELILHNFGLQVQALRSEVQETIGIELNHLRNELAKATAESEFYKNEYLKAVFSRSWKITAPLRSATEMTQRLKTFLRHGKPAD
jgi:hypothetical protein